MTAVTAVSHTPRLATWRLGLCLLLPPLMWASNALLAQALVGAIAPLALNAWRWTLVLVLLMPWALALPRHATQVRAHWPYLMLAGALGMGSYNALQYLALRSSTATNVTLIGSSIPVWMMVMGRLFYARPMSAWQVLGALCSLAGVGLVICHGRWQMLATLHWAQGDALMVLASWVWAWYSWLLVRPPQSLVASGQAPWSWVEWLWIQTLFGVAWAWLCSASSLAWDASQHPWLPAGPAGWLGLLFIALGPSILAYRCWGLAVASVGPTTAGFFANLTPVFAAMGSAALLGQWPSWYQPAALLMMVAGIALASRR